MSNGMIFFFISSEKLKEAILNVLGLNFVDVFDFEHKKTTEDLLNEINEKLKNYPEKIEDIYKIVMALTK